MSSSTERHVHPILYLVSVAAGECVRTCCRHKVHHPWACLGCGLVDLWRPVRRKGGPSVGSPVVNYKLLESRL